MEDDFVGGIDMRQIELIELIEVIEVIRSDQK